MNVIITLALFVIALLGLNYMARIHVPYTKRVFSGLGLGIVFGAIIQMLFGTDSSATTKIIEWTNIVGSGYITFLQMVVIPLVFVSMVRAFTTMKEESNIQKIGGSVLSVLIGTVMVAAVVGMASVLLFKLDGAEFTKGAAETMRIASLQEQQTQVADMGLPEQIISFIPRNVFEDLANLRPTSVISVVIFSTFIGVSYLGVARKKPEQGETFKKIIDSLHAIVMRIVTLVLRMAPYGIFALMLKMVATSSWASLVNLGTFVIAVYFAIAVMFILHMILIAVFGINPIQYLKKTFYVLSFAFTSHSSAGSLPLNISTQTDALGIDAPTANFAGTFGLSIGQNGCGGVYPAMLVAIVAPTVGIDLGSPMYWLSVMGTIAISSFGVAGVGGGATFASLIVFGTLGLPVEIIGLLVSVEPVVDMGRTALNVNDSMIAGMITSKLLGTLDEDKFHDPKAQLDPEND